MRGSHADLQNEFRDLWDSVNCIDTSVKQAETASELAHRQLQEMQLFLEAVTAEREFCDRRVSEVDRRISRIELALSRTELQVFEEEDGQCVEVEEEERRVSVEEEEDEFAESHYLPVEFITKYLQERKSQN